MTRAATLSASASTGTGLAPTGAMMLFGGAAAPDGWLLCNGAAVSRTTYAALFAAIGTAYGAGDGSTTFNVPDYQNRVAVGVGGGKALAAKGGAASVTPTGAVQNTTLTEAQIASHFHSWRNQYANVGAGSHATVLSSNNGEAGELDTNTNNVGGNSAHTHGLAINAVSVEQPFLASNYIIKT